MLLHVHQEQSKKLNLYLYDSRDHALSNILRHQKCFQIFYLSVLGRNKGIFNEEIGLLVRTFSLSLRCLTKGHAKCQELEVLN